MLVDSVVGMAPSASRLIHRKEFGRPANVQEMVTTLKALNEHTIMYYGYYRCGAAATEGLFLHSL